MPTVHVYHVVQTIWARLIITKTWHNLLLVYCAHNINFCAQKMLSHAHNLLSCAHNSLSRAHENLNKSCTRNNTCKLWKWTNSSVSLYKQYTNLSLLWHSPQSPWQHSYKSWCFSWFQVWCFPQLFLLHFSRMVIRINTESHLLCEINYQSHACTVKALGFLLNCCFIMRQSHKFTLVMPKG